MWENQCDWAGSDALVLFPPGSDPELIEGVLLPHLNRSPAMHYVQATSQYVTVDISEPLQVVAFPRNAKLCLDEEKAHAGAQIMFESEDNLKEALRRTGMLVDMERNDGGERV